MRIKKANKAKKTVATKKPVVVVAPNKEKLVSIPSEGPIVWAGAPRPMTEADILSAEEVAAAEEQLLGKRGVPHDFTCILSHKLEGFCTCGAGVINALNELNDDLPEFLQASAKAGPAKEVDALGRVDGKTFPKEAQPAPAILMPPFKDNKVSDPNIPSRTVTLVKDHSLEYPELYLSVYILPDPAEPKEESNFIRMFARTGCYRADHLHQADLVVFGGGSDVDPRLYAESKHPMTCFSDDRDNEDLEAYLYCVENGIPMFGVCRGAQFLSVMNGGKLYQDIDNHHGPHKMFAMKDKLLIENVSSSHHQSVRLNIKNGMEILGVTSLSTKRWKNADEKEEGLKPDIEAFWYRDTGCFGVQGHPEYAGYSKYQVWCLEKINDLFLCNPDFEWDRKNGVYRMKPDLIGQRVQRQKDDARKQEEIEFSYVQHKEA